MPKKQNAAKRRKNGGIGDDDGDNKEVDMLSDSYTILSDDQSLGDNFNDEFPDESLDLDDLIEEDVSKASSAATKRHSKVLDCLSIASTLSIFHWIQWRL